MSKREKHKWTSTRKSRPSKIRPFKSNSKSISLKEKLKTIYESINLETTCNGRCECCRVAMPQIHHVEFLSIINEIWATTSRSEKIKLICTSVEYFFRNEFEKFGIDTLLKTCMLLSEDGKCKYYQSRPLSCRMYGLWPEKTYNERVDKFEKAYEGLLKREDLPLNTQCPYVKRIDDSIELTDEVINGLYAKLDDIDKKIGGFSDAQMEHKENYRTFHDWILLKVFGEDFLSSMTSFMLGADKDTIMDQIRALKQVISEKFAKEMPNIAD